MTARWPVLSDRVGVQDRHDFARKATPINADDGPEKARRIATALITCTDPNARSLMMRELGRLEWLIVTEK